MILVLESDGKISIVFFIQKFNFLTKEKNVEILHPAKLGWFQGLFNFGKWEISAFRTRLVFTAAKFVMFTQ
jgi:hypothetical protein